jgi:hypothetical protein
MSEGPFTKFQGIAAIVGIAALGGSVIYNVSQSSSANSVMIQNHTSEITALQNNMNTVQVTMASNAALLAAINQKLDDMQASMSGGNRR